MNLIGHGGGRVRARGYQPVSPASLSFRLRNLRPPPARTASHTPIAVTAATSDASTRHHRSFIISTLSRPPHRGGKRESKGMDQEKNSGGARRQQQGRPGMAPPALGTLPCLPARVAGGVCCAGLFRARARFSRGPWGRT
uniref:Uncharacterized protein n=1 Tax=Oryza brachyantha TaxID=4533 RepID=J3LGL7_ORYBR